MKRILLMLSLGIGSVFADSTVDELLAPQQSTPQQSTPETVPEKNTQKAIMDQAEKWVDIPQVDLDQHQNESVLSPKLGHVLSNPWWENTEIYGTAAVGYYHFDDENYRYNGTFSVKEATLFVESAVWDQHSFFFEIQTTRLWQDAALFTRTGELYLHFRNLSIGNQEIGIKFGRIDVPFGEEYLWQDSIDNPLITNSTAYPYAFDEGILVYGDLQGVGWVAAIMDGSEKRGSDDHSDKAYSLKIYSDITPSLFASASVLKNGKSSKAAFQFADIHIQPVANSPSLSVDSTFAEVDIRYHFVERSYIATMLGSGRVRDDAPGFSRDLLWFSVEPYWQFSRDWYVLMRYSEIGTGSDQEGYHFGTGGGYSTFGFNTKRYTRWALGLGWTPNHNMRLKLEVGQAVFHLVDAASIDATQCMDVFTSKAYACEQDDEQGFFGFEISTKF